MPLIGFNNSPPPSIHLLRVDEASNPGLKVPSDNADDAPTSVDDGSSLLNHFPLVRLDVDVITDSIAGRLATSLLGHVLFLKNQIPL
jgi:hypothetical protein